MYKLEHNPYACDQCGTTNIVAAPLLYQQETRTYSGSFYAGRVQSQLAHSVSPPRARGYIRPFLLWGPALIILFAWTLIAFSSLLDQITLFKLNATAMFLLLDLLLVAGLVLNLRRIGRYNRLVYPGLRWDWEHTYVCRRCGRFRLIPL